MGGGQRHFTTVWHVLCGYLLIRLSLVGELLGHLWLKLRGVHLSVFRALILLCHWMVLGLGVLLHLMLLLHHLLVFYVVSVVGVVALRVLVLVHR